MRHTSKGTIFISARSNLFVFVGELCGMKNHPWHKERMAEWLRESGGRLNKKGRMAQKQFQALFVHANYDPIEAYAITLEPQVSKRLIEQELGSERARDLQRILRIFTPRFQKLWKKRQRRLTAIQHLLRTNAPALNAAIGDITALCGGTSKTIIRKRPPIHLLMSSDNKDDCSGWFSQTTEHFDLVLECSHRLNAKNSTFVQLILLHELFHATLRANRSLYRLIKRSSDTEKNLLRRYSKTIPPEMYLEEMLISSFIPEGYLAFARFGSPLRTASRLIRRKGKGAQNMTRARLYCAYRMRDMAKTYLEEKKPIDAAYLKTLLLEMRNGWRSLPATR